MDEKAGLLVADRFQIQEVLGRGGFGTTYAALDTTTGNRVAVKELDLERVDGWKAIELFERESRTLQELDHPQIPDYVAFIASEEDRTTYLVQELAPGADLERVLAAQGRIEPAVVRDIAEQVLDILVYLGSRRPPVVHRDIKPSNLILDEDDRVYLVDFGAVRDTARQCSTSGSTVVGTFEYMAPEQLGGQAVVASDLYALGMTLIHLLCGRSPNDMQKRRLKPDFGQQVEVEPQFAAFIDRLIEPVPEDRFITARAALNALRAPAPKTISRPLLAAATPPVPTATGALVENPKCEERRGSTKTRTHTTIGKDELKLAFHGEYKELGLGLGCISALLYPPIGAALVYTIEWSPFFASAGLRWLVLFVIWFGLLLPLATFVLRSRPLTIKVDEGGYAISRKISARQLDSGALEELTINASIDNEGWGVVRVSTPRFTEEIDQLNPDDAHSAAAFAQSMAQRFSPSEVVLGIPASAAFASHEEERSETVDRR